MLGAAACGWSCRRGAGWRGARPLHCNTSHLSPGAHQPCVPHNSAWRRRPPTGSAPLRSSGGRELHPRVRPGVGQDGHQQQQDGKPREYHHRRQGQDDHHHVDQPPEDPGGRMDVPSVPGRDHCRRLWGGTSGVGRPDEPANRTLAHRTPGPRPTHARAPRKPRHRRAIGARDSGRPSTVQEERGVLPPSAESRLRRLLPDRDVASTLGCERFAMPSAPPLPQRHPRELRHEVELGWPGDSSMPWTRTPPRLSGSAIRPVPMPNSRAAPDPARSAKKSRLGCTNAGSNSSGHNVS